MTIDLGTGDGRAVLAAAALEPTSLVRGLDASATAMFEASRLAARPASKGGRPNARFLVAAAEAPPPALSGVASAVTIRFPWGSLLRGVLGLDPAVAEGIATLVAPTGSLELLLAPSGRDGLGQVPTAVADIVVAARRTFEPLGFELEVGREATAAEVAASGSTWAKRLGAGRARERRNGAAEYGRHDRPDSRTVTLVRLVRRGRR